MHEILSDLNLFIRVRNLEQSFINVETTTRYYNVTKLRQSRPTEWNDVLARKKQKLLQA